MRGRYGGEWRVGERYAVWLICSLTFVLKLDLACSGSGLSPKLPFLAEAADAAGLLFGARLVMSREGVDMLVYGLLCDDQSA